MSEEAMHRNLIDACSKFQLLEIMLPKLRERGHRVLIFSQFLEQLDLIEDFLKGLDLSFRRIDGSVSAQEKQKRIDDYNAKESSIFACLLSTRAGGVGINLATADTVIIMARHLISSTMQFADRSSGSRFQRKCHNAYPKSVKITLLISNSLNKTFKLSLALTGLANRKKCSSSNS